MNHKELIIKYPEVPRGCWMSAEFLQKHYGVTDVAGFRYDPNGWGGKPRYMIPYSKNPETQKP